MKVYNLILLGVLYFSSLNITAQEKQKLNNKNTLTFGVNYATTSIDEKSYMFRNEYTRYLNNYFDLSVGLSFFSSSDSLIIPIGIQPNSVTGYTSTSVIPFDLILHLKVIDIEKHLLRLGVGYSLKKVRRVSGKGAINISNVNVPVYSYINSFESGGAINIEYGYRISKSFLISVNGRYYSEGDNFSLASGAGINLSYIF